MDSKSCYVLVIGQDSGIGRVGPRFVEVESSKGLEGILGKYVRVRVCTSCDNVEMCLSPHDDKFKPVDPASVVGGVLRELVNPFNILQGDTWGTNLEDVTRCTVVGAFTVGTLRTFGACCPECDKCSSTTYV